MDKAPFGLRLYNLWKETSRTADMNQKELGKALDISQSMLSQMISGQKLPSHEKAIEIALYFGVCTEWLLTERGPKYPGTAAADVIELEGLDSSSKAALRAFLATLKKPRAANQH